MRVNMPHRFTVIYQTILLLFIIAAISGLVGCRENNHPSPANIIFRMNLATEPPDLDPIKISDLTSFTVVQNIFRGLTLIDEQSNVVPAIAKRWERSDDGLSYTFYLREDARWSDGKAVTAQHFIDGWQRALTPTNAAD